MNSPARVAFLLTRVALAALFAIAATAHAEEAADYNRPLTSTARILAGLDTDYPPHARFTALPAWQQHRDTVGKVWARLSKQRTETIDRWRADAFAVAPHACTNLLYPFSGPDFLNAYIFFPDCDTYVMFGLEVPGRVPHIDRLNDEDAAALLDDMHVALEDLLKRNYFITEKMTKQLRTPHLRGVLPIILGSMALFDIRIVKVEPYDFWSKNRVEVADPQAKKARRMQAVKITFLQPASNKPQTLYYFSLDATNDALRFNPEFLPFLAKFKPAFTFIKSASYLLHGPYFTKTRDVLLDATDFLVQDDTGIPYRYLQQAHWQVHLYGEYDKPVKDFGKEGYQRDLEDAYLAANPGRLPFPFGYHWWDGKSSLMIALPAGAETPAPKAADQ